jgi:NitT/TauT family transport system permease protein/taurine transport system permease protein
LNSFVRRIISPGTLLGTIPFVLLLLCWHVAPRFFVYPEYVLPALSAVGERLVELLRDGSLWSYTSQSLQRLALGFVVGNAIAIPLGILIAVNRRASDVLLPPITFFQSIAGIAWAPLAVLWFGIGTGCVVFVIANTIFFGSIYNTIAGVRSIKPALWRATLCHGASRTQVLTHLILPGALSEIVLGLRTSMAYGWRALVAAEMIAGTNGLGYMTIEAVKFYATDTILLGMALIGVLWLAMDRLIFAPIEQRTVVRWGMVQR